MEPAGTWYVLPTAFAVDGELDLGSQARLVEAVLGWGVDGLVALGVTGEAAALDPSERDAVVRAVVDAAAGRAPVVVGCAGQSAHPVRAMAARARELGADGVLVLPPLLARDAAGAPAFFARVAEAGLPIVLQDDPAASGVRLPVELLLRAAEACRASAVKLEDPPTPAKIAELLAARPDLRVFGGLGGLHALGELRRGAVGTMTGFAYPEVLRAVRLALGRGDAQGAARVFDRHLPLIAFEAQPGIGVAIRKELLRRRGALASATTRMGGGLDPVTLRELDEVLERVGIAPSPGPYAVGP
ncbi:MAG TPA: dihydrodipicolinate synthase family protein [Actinomycetota bacterium]|nr:dihydrodipicolinate synthase family protein [Actinomycetota bacterium]